MFYYFLMTPDVPLLPLGLHFQMFYSFPDDQKNKTT
jgi:hypothetical protein